MRNFIGVRLWSFIYFCMVVFIGVGENLILVLWLLEFKLLEGFLVEDIRMWGYFFVKL